MALSRRTYLMTTSRSGNGQLHVRRALLPLSLGSQGPIRCSASVTDQPSHSVVTQNYRGELI
jgi:hypothetical protein